MKWGSAVFALGLAAACNVFDSSEAAMELRWPAPADTMRDSSFLAVVRLRDDLATSLTATFTAHIDSGADVVGERQSNVVLFPLAVSGNREHVLTIASSGGDQIVRVFTLEFNVPPRIHTLSVDSATRGGTTVVEIGGDRFAPDLVANQVLLNGVPMDVVAATESAIRFTLPNQADVHSGVLIVKTNNVPSPEFFTFRVVGDSGGRPIGAVWPDSGRPFIPVRAILSGVPASPSPTPVFNGIPGLPFFRITVHPSAIGDLIEGWTLIPAGAPLGLGNLQIQTSTGLSPGYPFTIQ